MADTDRRGFLTGVGLAALGAGLAGQGATRGADAAALIDRRKLGSTGREVGIYGLGLGSVFIGPHAKDFDGAHELLLRAIDVHGVSYWDTSADYTAKDADGKPVYSEAVVGRTLKDPKVRERVFMVTKSGKRDYDGFKRDVEASLTRLQTDHIDLYHMHDLQPRNADLDKMEAGCIKAARELKAQGVIKHFGVTGHTNAQILMDAIKRFSPDAVMTTFPAGRPDNGRYEDELRPLAIERKMALIAMKTIRQARAADIRGADLIRYALSLEGVCVAIAGIDTIAHLDDNAKMATNFTPLTAAQKVAMNESVRLALGDERPPWLRPGYRDGVVV